MSLAQIAKYAFAFLIVAFGILFSGCTQTEGAGKPTLRAVRYHSRI